MARIFAAGLERGFLGHNIVWNTGNSLQISHKDNYSSFPTGNPNNLPPPQFGQYSTITSDSEPSSVTTVHGQNIISINLSDICPPPLPGIYMKFKFQFNALWLAASQGADFFNIYSRDVNISDSKIMHAVFTHTGSLAPFFSFSLKLQESVRGTVYGTPSNSPVFSYRDNEWNLLELYITIGSGSTTDDGIVDFRINGIPLMYVDDWRTRTSSKLVAQDIGLITLGPVGPGGYGEGLMLFDDIIIDSEPQFDNNSDSYLSAYVPNIVGTYNDFDHFPNTEDKQNVVNERGNKSLSESRYLKINQESNIEIDTTSGFTLIEAIEASDDNSGTTLSFSTGLNLQKGDFLILNCRYHGTYVDTTIEITDGTNILNLVPLQDDNTTWNGFMAYKIITDDSYSIFSMNLSNAKTFRQMILFHCRPYPGCQAVIVNEGEPRTGSSTTQPWFYTISDMDYEHYIIFTGVSSGANVTYSNMRTGWTSASAYPAEFYLNLTRTILWYNEIKANEIIDISGYITHSPSTTFANNLLPIAIIPSKSYNIIDGLSNYAQSFKLASQDDINDSIQAIYISYRGLRVGTPKSYNLFPYIITTSEKKITYLDLYKPSIYKYNDMMHILEKEPTEDSIWTKTELGDYLEVGISTGMEE